MRDKKKGYGIFVFTRFLVKLFYPKMKVSGLENLPDEPAIIVGNHCQMNGPIVGELYVPNEPYIWCAGEMMNLKEVPEYAFRDFWSSKPKWTHPFYKLLSKLIAPLSVRIFTNARTIGVYHDTRIMTTFKCTVKMLLNGKSVVIFPEHNTPYNHIVCEFQDRFIDVAKLYYKKTGKELAFVPMYIAPKLRTLYLGKPVRFDADAPIDAERKRICTYLMDEITAIAEALPEHTVVPYSNIPQKQYPLNVQKQKVTINGKDKS